MTVSKTKAGFASEKVQNFIVSNTTAEPQQIASALLEYEMLFKAKGVADLYGAICYANSKGTENVTRQMLVSLMHDINGRKDEYMLPRTNGYADFADWPAYME